MPGVSDFSASVPLFVVWGRDRDATEPFRGSGGKMAGETPGPWEMCRCPAKLHLLFLPFSARGLTSPASPPPPPRPASWLPAPRHPCPHTLQTSRSLSLASLNVGVGLRGRLTGSRPPPCVRLGGASPGTVAETPTWHSPERLAAGQGVAGMWGGPAPEAGCDPAWSAPHSGAGLGGWQMGALLSFSTLLLLLPPLSPHLCFLCLSVCL